LDSAGNVYVADTGNCTIRKLTQLGTNWISSTIAGLASSRGTADGTNSDARFASPLSVAVDRAGIIYVADWGSSEIRKLTPMGTNWVSSTIGNDAQFNFPGGVAVDSAGNVYVADSRNFTIRKLTPVGTSWVSHTIAGLAGHSGSTDGTNSDARFTSPAGVALNSVGDIYVTDVTTIRKLSPVGTNWVLSTIAGLAGTSGSTDGTNGDARFQSLGDVAVNNAGNVYVGDAENHTIRRLTLVGTNWVSSTIAGLAGSSGSTDGTNSGARFYYPSSVALDRAGDVYVADSGNNTIRKLTLVGTNWVSSTIAGVGGSYYGSTDSTNGASVRFDYPYDVAVDAQANVFVADQGNNTIRKLTQVGSNWMSSTIAGLAGSQGSADGTNSDVRFFRPSGVSVAGTGGVYVVDGSSTIRKLTPIGTNWVSSTIAGQAGSVGSADGTNSDARFNYPRGVAVDSAGNVYVADTGNTTIRRLTVMGTNWVSSTVAGRVGESGSVDGTNSDVYFSNPIGVAADSAGNLYVTDQNTIRKLTRVGTNWVSSTIAGQAGSWGSADGTNSDVRFYGPNGVAVDGAGNVYVADISTIRKLTPLGRDWVSSTIGGLAGSVGPFDGTNSDARFGVPGPYTDGSTGVAVDSAGNVYVADPDNNTIREGVPLVVPPSAPVFESVKESNGLITFTWSASAGRAYQLQYSSDLSPTDWLSLGNTITATNRTMSSSDILGADRQRFYRLVLLP
jgi:hypothetical protein